MIDDRTARQEECRVGWIKHKCKGTLEACTGFGKTRVGIDCIKSILKVDPDKTVLIVVPTTALKDQWLSLLDSQGLSLNCTVEVINTVIKHEYTCDLVVIDEIHRVFAETFKKVFEKVRYSMILGLTATIERLDGKHVLINKFCPVFDRITLAEAQLKGWVSAFKEYQVILDVDDIDIYKEYNKSFTEHFEFFGFSFDRALKCVGKDGFKERAKLRDEMCPNGTEEERKKVFKNINYHAIGFTKAIQQRKAFINNHPKKLEVARRIIEAFPDKKIITFSNNVKMAESIGIGYVYTGRDSKKKGRITLEEFSKLPSGVLSSVRKADEGLDLPGLSIAIMLGIDSSKIKATQRVGRVVRREGDKEAMIFNLIINSTVETKWFENSHIEGQYITIDENGLNDILQGKEPKPYVKNIPKFTFRY